MYSDATYSGDRKMPETKTEARNKKSIRTTVSIPGSDYEQLERLAKQKKVSVAWVVREAVDQYLSAETPLLRKVR